MEKVNRLTGRDLFVDEDTDAKIHPFNNLIQKTPEEWEEMGIFYRYGRWNRKETEKLLQNWEDYLKSNPTLENPLELLDRRGNFSITRYSKRTCFYQEISKSLNRSTYSCYSKLQRHLHRRALKNGSFSDQEMSELKKLKKIHGDKYQVIGDIMGRDKQSVKDKCRTLVKQTNHGKWTDEEEKLLIQTIKDITGVDDLIQLKLLEIPWRKIAKRIPSRHEEQCRSHFTKLKRWQLQSIPSIVTWKKRYSRKLVQAVLEGNYAINADIDWAEIYKSFTSESSSPRHLESIFHRLKCQIPDSHKKSLTEILEELDSKMKKKDKKK